MSCMDCFLERFKQWGMLKCRSWWTENNQLLKLIFLHAYIKQEKGFQNFMWICIIIWVKECTCLPSMPWMAKCRWCTAYIFWWKTLFHLEIDNWGGQSSVAERQAMEIFLVSGRMTHDKSDLQTYQYMLCREWPRKSPKKWRKCWSRLTLGLDFIFPRGFNCVKLEVREILQLRSIWWWLALS